MADNEKDPNSPATTSAAYDLMAPRWHLINCLLSGTEGMRAAGEEMAPRYPEETQESYEARLVGAVLLNMVEQTLKTLTGKPFSKAVTPNDDIPSAIKSRILDDVDLQGNNLDVFSRNWFKEGFAKAFAHVLIDYPKKQKRADGKPRTLADDRKEGLRPYWVLISPEDVLYVRSEIRDGAEYLTQVRIREVTSEESGFTEIYKERIRVLRPGVVEIYEKTKQKGGKEEWKMIDEWTTGLGYIPLVTFYTDKQGCAAGKPPLLDLAYLNQTHWISTSDQRHILTVARFPILACSGASKDDSDPITVGPDRVLYNSDPQGKFYYVEHAGNAIEAGRKDLEELERQMAGYGAEFLKRRPGGETATARALDTAESNSDLASMALVFEDAVAQALSITAEWMGLGDQGGTIEVVKDYGQQYNQAAFEIITKLREKRDLSRVTILKILKTWNILPEDFSEEDDLEELMNEALTLGASSLDLDPAGGEGEPGDEDDDPDDDNNDNDKGGE